MDRIINNPDLVVEDAVRGYPKVDKEPVAPTDAPPVIRHRLIGAPARSLGLARVAR